MRQGRKKTQVGAIKQIPGKPETPTDIASNPEKLAAWDRLCDDLHQQGNLLITDRELIRTAANVVVMLRQVEREIEQLPSLYITNSRGDLVQHPLVGMHVAYVTKTNRLLSDLRLTPGTRSKGTVPLASEDLDSGWTE